MSPLAGELLGNDVEFSVLATDTRTLNPGDVYLALVGENFDGNDFIEQALAKGASAAIVSKFADVALPQLKVSDTHAALGKIAALIRRRSKARLIALTGSQGKTTVKELLGAILQCRAPTLVTAANLNNTIGVPLTLLQLTEQHEFAVIEMGANCKGEIAFSVDVAQPDLALITLASAAHIEGFGSLEGIVQAKGEIIDGLGAEGVVLLNADDPNCESWIKRAGSRRKVLFSQTNKPGSADYYGKEIGIDDGAHTTFVLVSPKGEVKVSMNLLGKHNVTNAIAAAAAAMEAGASLDNIATGLGSVLPVYGRLKPVSGDNGSIVIDDTYNASPSSFFAAIDVLMCHGSPRILVAGDMRELGAEAEEAHRRVGEYAAKSGVDRVLTIGEYSKITAAACGPRATHFETKAELVAECRRLASPDTTFLVKGSRGARMDTVVAEISLSEEV